MCMKLCSMKIIGPIRLVTYSDLNHCFYVAFWEKGLHSLLIIGNTIEVFSDKLLAKKF